MHRAQSHKKRRSRSIYSIKQAEKFATTSTQQKQRTERPSRKARLLATEQATAQAAGRAAMDIATLAAKKEVLSRARGSECRSGSSGSAAAKSVGCNLRATARRMAAVKSEGNLHDDVLRFCATIRHTKEQKSSERGGAWRWTSCSTSLPLVAAAGSAPESIFTVTIAKSYITIRYKKCTDCWQHSSRFRKFSWAIL